MQDIEKLVATAEEAGIHLWLEGGALRFRCPPGTQGSPLFAQIKARKDEVVAFLGNPRAEQKQYTDVEKYLGVCNPALSLQQHWLWMTKDRLLPWKGQYNQVVAMRAIGEFDLRIWNEALTQLVGDHEALRTVYTDGEERMLAAVQAPSAVEAQVTDCTLSPCAAETQIANALASATRLAHEDIDMTRSPLLRAYVFRLDARDHLLLVAANHFVSDGYSLGIMGKELVRNYLRRLHGMPAAEQVRRQHHEYVRWQRESVANGVWTEGQAYWTKRYTEIENFTLPARYACSSAQARGAIAVMFSLPSETLQALRDLARQEAVGYQLLLVCIFQAALFLWSQQERFLLNIVYHGRHVSAFMDQIGLYMLTLLYPAICEGNPSLRSLLKQASQEWPLLVRDGGIPAKLATIETGRRDTVKVYLNVVADIGETGSVAGGGKVSNVPVEFKPQERPMDADAIPPQHLCAFVTGNSDQLTCVSWYRADIVSPEGIAALRQSFDKVVAAVVSRVDEPVLQL